eukprot:6176276-Pleurochrysis_carterae.AAC.2
MRRTRDLPAGTSERSIIDQLPFALWLAISARSAAVHPSLSSASACFWDFGSEEGAAANAQWVPRLYTRGALARRVSSTEAVDRSCAWRRCSSVGGAGGMVSVGSCGTVVAVWSGGASASGEAGTVSVLVEAHAGIRREVRTRANRKLRSGG